MLAYIKLTTGEEVIGELAQDNGSGNLSLTNPKVITIIPTAAGGTNVTLVPLMWSAKLDSSVIIYREAILSRAYVGDDKWEKMYIQSNSRLDLTSRITS